MHIENDIKSIGLKGCCHCDRTKNMILINFISVYLLRIHVNFILQIISTYFRIIFTIYFYMLNPPSLLCHLFDQKGFKYSKIWISSKILQTSFLVLTRSCCINILHKMNAIFFSIFIYSELPFEPPSQLSGIIWHKQIWIFSIL